jgi:nucleotide-binding universal stress UspA family protein
MFKRILIAYDGSEHARKAAKVAGELANKMHADLWVVIAYDPLPGYLGKPNMQDAIDARLDVVQEETAGAIKAIGTIKGKLTKEIIEGPATDAILNVAEVREIELIIMGSRGLGRLEGLLIGSHSQKVVSHAKCPVLLVR